jgi:hypothetical protein
VIHESPFNSGKLPSWFQKPRSSDRRGDLFRDDLGQVLTALSVGTDELRRWQLQAPDRQGPRRADGGVLGGQVRRSVS